MYATEKVAKKKNGFDVGFASLLLLLSLSLVLVLINFLLYAQKVIVRLTILADYWTTFYP